MTTLHEMLYAIDQDQTVTVNIEYTETVISDGMKSQKLERFTGKPNSLMQYLDIGMLKHIASIDSVNKDGVIQISSRPLDKLNTYRAYYTLMLPVAIGEGTKVEHISDIKAVNLNDALQQAVDQANHTASLKLIGINLIEGIG